MTFDMTTTLAKSMQQVVDDLSLNHRRVLEALLFAPNHSATGKELQKELGLSAVVQVNAAMGHIGRRVREVFGSHPEGFPDNQYEWWHVIATGEPVQDRGFVWKLREEVISGLQAAGMNSNGFSQPTEIDLTEGALFEGAVRKVTVNAYERNPVARSRCLEAYGYKCVVCDFDFGAVYGEAAAGFIHVHHTKPLAMIGEQYEVDPIEDLRPVCPNCHAVIHLVNPPRSIEEVIDMLRVSRN